MPTASAVTRPAPRRPRTSSTATHGEQRQADPGGGRDAVLAVEDGLEQGGVEGLRQGVAGGVGALQQQAGAGGESLERQRRRAAAGAAARVPAGHSSRQKTAPPSSTVRAAKPTNRLMPEGDAGRARGLGQRGDVAAAEQLLGVGAGLADGEGERTGDRVRVGADDPPDDQVAALGQAMASAGCARPCRRRSGSRRRCRPGRRRR